MEVCQHASKGTASTLKANCLHLRFALHFLVSLQLGEQLAGVYRQVHHFHSNYYMLATKSQVFASWLGYTHSSLVTVGYQMGVDWSLGLCDWSLNHLILHCHKCKISSFKKSTESYRDLIFHLAAAVPIWWVLLYLLN